MNLSFSRTIPCVSRQPSRHRSNVRPSLGKNIHRYTSIHATPKDFQWGLGLEHEFSIDLGHVDTFEKERYVSEKLGLPFSGSRVILDLRDLVAFPQTRNVSFGSSLKDCMGLCAEGSNMHSLIHKVHVFLPEKQKVVEVNLQESVSTQEEVLHELCYYETGYILGNRETYLIPTKSRASHPLRSCQDMLRILNISLHTLSPYEKVKLSIAIEKSGPYPIMAEVKSEKYRNQSPCEILKQVSDEEKQLLHRIDHHLQHHDHPEYQRFRNVFNHPQLVYSSWEDRVLKIGRSLELIDTAYMGSYHFWVTVPHPLIEQAHPQNVWDIVLPEYIENTRVFCYLVQWIEPILLYAANDGYPSYRHRHNVQTLGSTNLTQISLSEQASEVGMIPNLHRSNLTGRVISYQKPANQSLVTFESDRSRKRLVEYADIRTERLLDMVRVSVKDDNTIDLEFWKQNNKMFRGIEIRIFDNCPHERIEPIMTSLHQIAWIIVENSDSPYMQNLRYASTLESRRAIYDSDWKTVANDVIHGTTPNISRLLSRIQNMVSEDIYDIICKQLAQVKA